MGAWNYSDKAKPWSEKIMHYIITSFTSTVTVNAGDHGYDALQQWLSKQTFWSNAT
jgi:BCS1 N terminal